MSDSKNDEHVFTSCTVGGPVFVYARDGRITRVEPIQFGPDDAESWVIEPLGESRSDYEIFAMVARRLGFYEKYTEGGLTDLDWVKRMFNASDLPKYISWEEFEKKGYFVVPVRKDYKPTPALRWFAEDRMRDTPDWGPAGGSIEGLPDKQGNLGTQSGKIEFESQSLIRFDPNDPERPPVPHSLPS